MALVKLRILAALLVVLIGQVPHDAAVAATPAAATRVTTATAPSTQPDVLRTLRRDHPRLYVLDDDLARAKELIASDALARQWFALLRAAGDKMLDQPVAQ